MKNFDQQKAEQLLSMVEDKHKEVVKACIMSAKVKNKKNRRYTQDWMYNCILWRIKSGALYRKMLRDDTLPLPSLRTIQRYIRKIKPMFGYDQAIFDMMAKKCPDIPEAGRHGKSCTMYIHILLTYLIHKINPNLISNRVSSG